MSDEYGGHPSEDLSIVGVTATNGKTTTTYMIDAIFEERGRETGPLSETVIAITTSVIGEHHSKCTHYAGIVETLARSISIR
ncbi:MAG: hypothetical protein U5K84_12865 [Alkalibacterium sp.]|nr:hypothetical protein [Alkalibacterium sp.]